MKLPPEIEAITLILAFKSLHGDFQPAHNPGAKTLSGITQSGRLLPIPQSPVDPLLRIYYNQPEIGGGAEMTNQGQHPGCFQKQTLKQTVDRSR